MYTHTHTHTLHLHSLPKSPHTFAILGVRNPRNFPAPFAPPLALIFRDGLKHIKKKTKKYIYNIEKVRKVETFWANLKNELHPGIPKHNMVTLLCESVFTKRMISM